MKTTVIPSRYNGKLEVVELNGKKHLDSENANYSYGALQRVLKYGLSKISFDKINNVLLLGLGGGSVIKTLRDDFNYKGKITAVDIDPVIIRIAQEIFDIKEEPNLDIYEMDAAKFVQRTKKKYDLIIIDLFIDTKIPDAFYQSDFWMAIDDIMEKQSYFIFNTIYDQLHEDRVDTITQFFLLMNYEVERHDKINRHNTLLIGKKKGSF